MKTFRSLAAALFVFALGHVAAAQESSEVASLRAKAEKGNGIAQYNLGLAYVDGKGVARDPIEAFVWLSLARENGARGRALDNVAGSLDKASLELARQRIAERKTALGMTPAVPAAAKSATPAPAAVVENKPGATGATGTDTTEDPAVARLRKERDAYSTKVGEIAADLFTVRTDRDRLAQQATEIQRNAQAVSATSRSLQEQVRTAEARTAELERTSAAMQAELERTKQALATVAAAPKPAPDTAALEAKTRELQAALTELEAARQFGRKVEDTLNKVNDDKARVAASAAAELEAARQFGQQVEATLNKVNDQKAALEQQLATTQQALAAQPAAPGYPDLSGRVSELETALTAARKSAPAYPDLRERVAELESQFAGSQAAAKARAEELARANTKLAGDETAFAAVNRELAEAKHSLAQANQALATKPAAPKYPDLSGRVTELEAGLITARKAAPAYPDLRTNVAALEEQLAAAKQTLATKPAAPGYPDLRLQVGELETKLAASEKALAAKLAAPTHPDLSGRVNELEAALQTARTAAPAYPNLSGRVAELEGQAGALNAAVASSTQELAAVRAQLSTATQNLGAGAAEYATLQSQLTQLRTQAAAPKYPDLTGRVAELEKQLAARPGAAEQARADVTRQFDDYKSATAAAQRERTTLQSTLKMLESDKAALRRQVDAATSESNQLRTQVAALKTQAAAPRNLAPAYPDLSGKVTELEAALAATNQHASAQITSLTAERDVARNSQNELRDTATRLAQEKAELIAAKPAAAAFPDLSNRVGELEAALAATKQQLAAKPAAPGYPDLSGRVAELESALAVKPAAPTYPDLSGRVSELETALAAARNATPAYPNLAVKVTELETRLAATEKSAAPAYPDLSGKVAELSREVTQLRTDRERMQKLLADSGRQLAEATAASRSRPVAPPAYLDRVRELEAALAQAKATATPSSAPAYPDLSGRVSELETAAADSARRLIAAEAAQTGLQQQLAEATATAQNAAKRSGDSTQLRRERDELSGKVTDLAGEVSQLRTDRERMLKMLADAGRQMRDNTADTTRIKELEMQLAAAQSQTGGITSERDDARKVQNDLRDTITRLEQEKAQLVAANPNTAPAYPDLSGRVHELEAQIAAAPRGQATPAYPDLTGRVSELESVLAATKQQLAAAQAAPATPPAAGADTGGLEQKLADTEGRLTTALRGYATLQRERDALAENAGKSAAAVAAERDSLATQVASLTGQVEQLRASAQNNTGSTQAELARLNEAVTALQRTSTQASRDAAAARALAQQLQGANAVLAGENYQLKTMLARSTGGTAPATATVTAPAARTHVVVAGDSLSRLSQRYYGAAGRWQEIYNANATLLGPNGVLRVGTELRIP